MKYTHPPATYVIEDRVYCPESSADKAHRRHAVGIALRLTHLAPRSERNKHRPIHSIGSQRIFAANLVSFARFLEVNHAGNLRTFPPMPRTPTSMLAACGSESRNWLSDRWAMQILMGRQLPPL